MRIQKRLNSYLNAFNCMEPAVPKVEIPRTYTSSASDQGKATMRMRKKRPLNNRTFAVYFRLLRCRFTWFTLH